MGTIISVVNQKGGVGKTTTTVNLGAYLAKMGKRVLLVDLDSQGNASSGLGIRPSQVERGLYQALVQGAGVHDMTHSLEHLVPGLFLVPATMDLAGANVELINMAQREYRLKETLDAAREHYDFVLIDSPPSLGILAVNGLVASDEVLIPVQAEYYALEGLGQLLNTIDLVKKHLKPELNVLGAVLTMHDVRTKLSVSVLEELYKHFPRKIFRSVIPRNVRLAEAPSHGKTILQYDPSSRGGKAYEQLAEEMIAVLEYQQAQEEVED
jgi:chromosome partitioning protein